MTYNPRPADLSARDLFAMEALTGMGTWSPNDRDGISHGLNTTAGLEVRAAWAYAQADAMLKARKQRGDDQ